MEIYFRMKIKSNIAIIELQKKSKLILVSQLIVILLNELIEKMKIHSFFLIIQQNGKEILNLYQILFHLYKL